MAGVGDLDFRRVVSRWVVDRGIKVCDRLTRWIGSGSGVFFSIALEINVCYACSISGLRLISSTLMGRRRSRHEGLHRDW
jgi:hypothetical protein